MMHPRVGGNIQDLVTRAFCAVLGAVWGGIAYGADNGVVAKYVYYEDGEEPGVQDVLQSEMLEGRLREGFVRIRQLLALTRHEIRLRGPFNPLPYSALIDACERFFEYLVSVRQSSLFFHPHYLSDNQQASESLLAFRRDDAVACILMSLYVLAGALRGDRRVPRYLPSAASARKRLLDHVALLESMNVPATSSGVSVKSKRSKRKSKRKEQEDSNETVNTLPGGRKWSQIYSYSYSQSLTGCLRPILEEEYEDLTRGRVSAHGLLDGQITPRTTRC
ncbi:hypothetical protein DID88_003403 [Monilinia fructigena]|uniref:Uncharacterized protein n=1 Tax=Monilinia fructigena TaxID=38457 RepID=A0A395ITX2_9HELO|nr:hypothetical protein DID88_003403 [Monilinia fructigena]